MSQITLRKLESFNTLTSLRRIERNGTFWDFIRIYNKNINYNNKNIIHYGTETFLKGNKRI